MFLLFVARPAKGRLSFRWWLPDAPRVRLQRAARLQLELGFQVGGPGKVNGRERIWHAARSWPLGASLGATLTAAGPHLRIAVRGGRRRRAERVVFYDVGWSTPSPNVRAASQVR